LHCSDQLLGHPKAYPKAAIGADPRQGVETFEDLCLVAFRYSYAFVSNRELNLMTFTSEGDFNRPPRAVSNGIRKEVFQHLLHGHRITLCCYSFLHTQANGAAGTLGQWDHVRRNPPDQHGEIHLGCLEMQIAGADAGDFQKDRCTPHVGIHQPFEPFETLDHRVLSILGRFGHLQQQ